MHTYSQQYTTANSCCCFLSFIEQPKPFFFSFPFKTPIHIFSTLNTHFVLLSIHGNVLSRFFRSCCFVFATHAMMMRTSIATCMRTFCSACVRFQTISNYFKLDGLFRRKEEKKYVQMRYSESVLFIRFFSCLRRSFAATHIYLLRILLWIASRI